MEQCVKFMQTTNNAVELTSAATPRQGHFKPLDDIFHSLTQQEATQYLIFCFKTPQKSDFIMGKQQVLASPEYVGFLPWDNSNMLQNGLLLCAS
jgi:hypothetical protein